MTDQAIKVMISSTTRDLPEHRAEVEAACIDQGMLPVMMEHEPATAAEAVRFSEALVDGSKIYIGIFAHRYGYVPNDSDISVTEIEYERAYNRSLPRLIFLMHEDHVLLANSVELGDGAIKLQAFKERLKTELFLREFKSAADLRAHVGNSLAKFKEGTLFISRYVVNSPPPPLPYIAHPDEPFQSQHLIGRETELKVLTDWVSSGKKISGKARILCVVAPGGVGKSLLVWEWFNEFAPYEMPGVAGRMWWSFDNQDRFSDFIRCALSYVSETPLKELVKVPLTKCQAELLKVLDAKPFLIVLDSFERLLNAYTRTDAASLVDGDRERLANKGTAERRKLPRGGEHSFVGQQYLRQLSDPQVLDFLLHLAAGRKSRLLINTRLYPAALQTSDAEEIPGCKVHFLEGLDDVEAVNLWRSCNATGSQRVLIPLFRTFDNYPKLIRELAERIAGYHRAPDEQDQWRQDYPDFGV